MTLTLVTIAPGYQLEARAAASYARMRAAGCPPGITSAYRSSTLQAHLRREYLAGRGNYALPPGRSLHELGTALDLPEPARAWARTHGRAYGWVRDINPAEPWHLEYNPDLDQGDDMPITDDDARRIAAAVHERTVQYGLEQIELGRAAGRAGRNSERILEELSDLRSRIDQLDGGRIEPTDFTITIAPKEH